ncbi:MAG: N-acetyl-gamma-glutamyl-phosphate reductase [Acidimicrobiales bacterium]
MKVGVVGASGYAGAELLRLCAAHPHLDVVVAAAGAHAGEAVADHTPSLAAAYPSLAYGQVTAGDPGDSSDRGDPGGIGDLDGLDAAFFALPHGESQKLVPALAGRVGTVVDLAADFRLKDPAAYPAWYGEAHAVPELLPTAVYGLPELHRAELAGATLVAVPGCYPTAAVLALAPFLAAGAVEPSGIVVDATSGVSGAGRAPSDRLHFGAVDGDFAAYGLLDHRHTPEIEQEIGASVLFTPHLAPMARGVLATCYARPTRTLTTEEALGILGGAYDREPFVVVSERSPSTKAATGSNCAHLTARADPRTGWLVVLCALDNLVKGAAGQAIQCANLALGLPETEGLPVAGLYP